MNKIQKERVGDRERKREMLTSVNNDELLYVYGFR